MTKKLLISAAGGLIFTGFMLVVPVTLSNTHGEAMISVQKEVIQYTNTHGEGM
jgi:hypothetical protein